MVTKQVLRIAGLAGLVALAACSTGPLGVCVPDAENPSQVNCPVPADPDLPTQPQELDQ